MRNCIFAFGLLAFVGYFAFSYSFDYFNKEKTLIEYEKLITNHDTVMGKFDDFKSTISIKGIPLSKSVYRFTVDGIEYKKSIYKNSSLPSIMFDPNVRVYYSPENPKVCSLNPKRDLKELTEKNEKGFAIAFGIATIIVLLSFIFHVSQYRKKKVVLKKRIP